MNFFEKIAGFRVISIAMRNTKHERNRGRPGKGEERAKETKRLEKQLDMSVDETLDDLPGACDVGTEKKQ